MYKLQKGIRGGRGVSKSALYRRNLLSNTAGSNVVLHCVGELYNSPSITFEFD